MAAVGITESEVLPFLLRLWSEGVAHPCTHSHTCIPMVLLFYSTAADTELASPGSPLRETVQWNGNKIGAHLG